MSLLMNEAWAEGPAPATGDGGLSLIFMVLFVVFIYFFLIRPQSKRAKEHRNMVGSLAKGDEVTTTGGVLGRIMELGENYILLEVAEGVNMKVQKNAIGSLLPKGTIKDTL